MQCGSISAFFLSSDLGVSLIAFEVKNAVYGKWYRNVILATHGRISVAATVCACLLNLCF